MSMVRDAHQAEPEEESTQMNTWDDTTRLLPIAILNCAIYIYSTVSNKFKCLIVTMLAMVGLSREVNGIDSPMTFINTLQEDILWLICRYLRRIMIRVEMHPSINRKYIVE